MSATRRGGGAADEPVAGLVCPECGHDAESERALYRARRRRGLVWAGAAVLAVGLAGQTVPRALRVGPLGLVPTTVLIAGMGWLPVDWLEGSNRGDATLSARLREDAAQWQVDWAASRALSEIPGEEEPRRLAFLLRLAHRGDAERVAEAGGAVCDVLIGQGSAGWTAKERSEVTDALGGFLIRAYLEGGVRPAAIPADVLVKLLGSESAEMRRNGFTLAWNSRRSVMQLQVWELLWALSSHADPQIAFFARSVLASAIAQDDEATERWEELTRDSDPAVRAKAVAVAKYAVRERREIGLRLVEMMGDKDIAVLELVVEALPASRVSRDRWVAAVREVFLGTHPRRARLAAAMAAEPMAPRESFELLVEGCADTSAEVRGASVYALRGLVRGRVSVSELMPAAARLLDDPDERVRRLAAVAVLAVADASPEGEARFAEAVARAEGMRVDGVEFDEADFED